MPINKDSCPTVSPFEKKTEEPKSPMSYNPSPSKSSSSTSIFKSPFRNKSKNKLKTSSNVGSNESCTSSKSIIDKEKHNGCKAS